MAKGRPRSSLSTATPLVRTADPRPGSINAHLALCVAQGLAGVISRAARPVDSACHRGNQHRLGDRAYHVDPQWLSQRVSQGHLRCCGGDLPVRPSPMNRTASMILGHWCSKYCPFDPRSWKAAVGASPGNGRRRSGPSPDRPFPRDRPRGSYPGVSSRTIKGSGPAMSAGSAGE